MNTEQVDAMLSSYNACKARLGHLNAELEIAQHQRDFIAQNAMYLEAQKAQQYDGMPHGSSVGNPVESLVLKFDGNYKPKYLKDLDSDLYRLKHEKFELEMVVSFVDSWMIALTERERFIIQRHVIEKCFWRQILEEYEQRWGIFSKEGLRKLKKKAMDKIYMAAE